MNWKPQLYSIMVSPILPIGLAIIATAFTLLFWIVGEQVFAALLTGTASQISEQGQPIVSTLRYEWIALPVGITICLWIWAALVVTRRQVVTAPQGYY